MKHEQQQQAEHLYFQTDLSKTQIAETVGISRRALHYWIRDNHWEQLKKSGAAMPSLIAGNCYQMMAQLSAHILSEERKDQPVTRHEVDSLYKLTLTIHKLRARTVLSESMETFTGFLDSVSSSDPELALRISPYVSMYLSSRSAATTATSQPRQYSTSTPLSPEQALREAELDKEDLAAWAQTVDTVKRDNPIVTPASSPAPQTTQEQAEAKYDIRKQLRGTATKGPGKAFYKRQNRAA